jgi:hypothetical protein
MATTDHSASPASAENAAIVLAVNEVEGFQENVRAARVDARESLAGNVW